MKTCWFGLTSVRAAVCSWRARTFGCCILIYRLLVVEARSVATRIQERRRCQLLQPGKSAGETTICCSLVLFSLHLTTRLHQEIEIHKHRFNRVKRETWDWNWLCIRWFMDKGCGWRTAGQLRPEYRYRKTKSKGPQKHTSLGFYYPAVRNVSWNLSKTSPSESL